MARVTQTGKQNLHFFSTYGAQYKLVLPHTVLNIYGASIYCLINGLVHCDITINADIN